MPARTIQQSIQYRKWVDAALRDGADSPTRILEWIEQHKSEDMPSPSLPTVSKIMKDKGYKPTGARWELQKGSRS
jgi:hypothetical protein